MKQLIDFAPVLAFFVIYFIFKDFMLATYVLVGASGLQIALTWTLYKRIDKTQLVTFLILLPLAGLTVALNDERFLKWKPTIVNWAFAVTLLGSDFIIKKNLVRLLLENMFKSLPDVQLNLPEVSWRFINWYASGFFIIAGCLNLWVAFQFSTDTWVQFKLFGLMGLNLIGFILLFIYLSKHINNKPKEKESPDQAP